MTGRQFFRALLGWLVVVETVRQGASVLGTLLRPEQPQTVEMHEDSADQQNGPATALKVKVGELLE